eukprot:CAMPEP_0194331998 /NCGR_PEP_ID=MMETSP0171-20130528/57647_1 /TAXON_ID=218684 /ORGANISM="Corethron pennatum, Strain L29A3" /LENGTH=346 /DNA_ID=CAMNT_0039093683 /DNA_START=100 /DNA_END=1137 /DNA_ORIENTATION=-
MILENNEAIEAEFLFKHKPMAFSNENEAQSEFETSINCALKKVGICIDRMKDRVQKTDDALSLVDARLTNLYSIESTAIAERKELTVLRVTNILFLPSLTKILELDDIICAIQGEMSDAEANKATLKARSALLQVDLDAIVQSHTEARSIILRSLSKYKHDSLCVVKSIDDDCLSLLTKQKVIEYKLYLTLEKNKMLEEQLSSTREKLELVLHDKKLLLEQVKCLRDDLDKFEKKFAQELNSDSDDQAIQNVMNDNKILKDQATSVKKELELLKKRDEKNKDLGEKLNAIISDNRLLKEQIRISKLYPNTSEKQGGRNIMVYGARTKRVEKGNWSYLSCTKYNLNG